MEHASPAAQLDVTLIPINNPIVIPASGGTFDFVIDIDNTGMNPQSLDTWIAVILPDGQQFSPVLGPIRLDLAPGSSLSRIRTQNVPDGSPGGTYRYEIHLGQYPDETWLWDAIFFVKEGGGEGSSISEWENYGENILDNPDDLSINQNNPENLQFRGIHPNPFNPVTKFSFVLPEASHVSLKIYNFRGQSVATLVDGTIDVGSHNFTFNASNLASGIYLYRLTAGSNNISGKMMLMK